MFRVNGQPAIGLAIAMRDGGDILALGKNIQKAMDEAPPTCRSASNRILVADQAVTVKSAIARLHGVAVAGGRHHPRGQLHQRSACAPGLVVALAIPLTLAIVFAVMESSTSTCSASRSAR